MKKTPLESPTTTELGSRPAKGQLHLGRHLHSWYDGRAEPITAAAQLRTQGLGNAPRPVCQAPMDHSTSPFRPSLDPLLLGALVGSIRTALQQRPEIGPASFPAETGLSGGPRPA